jgi:hypothetical protein
VAGLDEDQLHRHGVLRVLGDLGPILLFVKYFRQINCRKFGDFHTAICAEKDYNVGFKEKTLLFVA